MPILIPRSFEPNAVINTETDFEADIDLTNLVNVSFADPIGLVPGLAVGLLVGSLILPAAAELLYNLTGTVTNVVQIAHDVQEIALEECFCEQLTRIADGIADLKKKVLKIEVTSYPDDTRITLGQDGGPDVLYPLGWVQFSEDNIFWHERHFILYKKQIIVSDVYGDNPYFNLFKWPGVQMTATLV